MSITWNHAQTVPSLKYTCGFCSNPIASNHGYLAAYVSQPAGTGGKIYICHQCEKPTFFAPNGSQTPGSAFGSSVQDCEKSVGDLYEEARRVFAAQSFTAVVLCCRKLLMHVAVSKGAAAGESFVSYVEFLANKGYVPPDAKVWVDHIRQKGNEANHDITIMQRPEAEDLLSFCEMLLKLVYEFPALANKKAKVGP